MKKLTAIITALLTSAALTPAVAAADEVNFNVAMPSLLCVNTEAPNECTLTGEMMARGPAGLVKPIKYYCEVTYTYVAAESAQNEIRFSKRFINHGEITLKNGRGRKSLSETVTLDLPNKARKIDLSTISCYVEPK